MGDIPFLLSSYIPLIFPVIKPGGCMYTLAALCPILIRTSLRGLLNLAPGSSENMQVPFAG